MTGGSAAPEALGDRLRADLTGRDPDRIAAALRQARELLPGERIDLPFLGPDLWDAFPGRPPWDVVRDYVWLVAHYPAFTPAMTAADRVRCWVATILRTGDTAAALQVAQYLRGMRRPGADIDAAFRVIAQYVGAAADSGPEFQASALDQPARTGAAALVGHLLEQDESHDRAARALGDWAAHPGTAHLVPELAPGFDPDDRRPDANG